jgi:hypothetical protein
MLGDTPRPKDWATEVGAMSDFTRPYLKYFRLNIGQVQCGRIYATISYC